MMKSAGFCTEHSAQSRGIGFEFEISPTLRGGVTPAVIIERETDDENIDREEVL